jgi:hypothetical protein
LIDPIKAEMRSFIARRISPLRRRLRRLLWLMKPKRAGRFLRRLALLRRRMQEREQRQAA